jgi:hypothetical protein
MSIVYKVLNPLTGQYNTVSSKEECANLLLQTAWDLYLNQTHNIPYAEVTINEDNSETWKNGSGDIIPSASDIQKRIDINVMMRDLNLTILGDE